MQTPCCGGSSRGHPDEARRGQEGGLGCCSHSPVPFPSAVVSVHFHWGQGGPQRCQLLQRFVECAEPQNKVCGKDKVEPVICCREVSVALCSCWVMAKHILVQKLTQRYCEWHSLWPGYGISSTNDFCSQSCLLPLAETNSHPDNVAWSWMCDKEVLGSSPVFSSGARCQSSAGWMPGVGVLPKSLCLSKLMEVACSCVPLLTEGVQRVNREPALMPQAIQSNCSFRAAVTL